MNSIAFGGEKGRGQKVVAYSDTVNDDKMISPATTVHDEFIIIYKGDYFIFWENDNALSLYCLLKRVSNLLDDIPFE